MADNYYVEYYTHDMHVIGLNISAYSSQAVLDIIKKFPDYYMLKSYPARR